MDRKIVAPASSGIILTARFEAARATCLTSITSHPRCSASVPGSGRSHFLRNARHARTSR